MLLYPTFIPNQNNYNMLGIKLGIKIKTSNFLIRFFFSLCLLWHRLFCISDRNLCFHCFQLRLQGHSFCRCICILSDALILLCIHCFLCKLRFLCKRLGHFHFCCFSFFFICIELIPRFPT